ncbi:hypothetical protein [Castellaniella sp.]|uniref:hypothetical protein n=1 Tax=Castellaniella sp. TaxID=1955812 RepID=UPI002AFE5736|nr:hypothetical protein [Castellaniella sp.]
MNIIGTLRSAADAESAANRLTARGQGDGPAYLSPPSSDSDVSPVGKILSQMTEKAGDFQDIEDSNLPEAIKSFLKIIRKLQQELAELYQKLQAIQADSRLDPEAKKQQTAQLQSQISQINGAVSAMTHKLADLIRELKLDSAQSMKVASLLAR